jgi:hypothetical protein
MAGLRSAHAREWRAWARGRARARLVKEARELDEPAPDFSAAQVRGRLPNESDDKRHTVVAAKSACFQIINSVSSREINSHAQSSES